MPVSDAEAEAEAKRSILWSSNNRNNHKEDFQSAQLSRKVENRALYSNSNDTDTDTH